MIRAVCRSDFRRVVGPNSKWRIRVADYEGNFPLGINDMVNRHVRSEKDASVTKARLLGDKEGRMTEISEVEEDNHHL